MYLHNHFKQTETLYSQDLFDLYIGSKQKFKKASFLLPKIKGASRLEPTGPFKWLAV